jgi:hypothetical protein
MFTLKTLIVLAIVALALYCVKSIWSIALQSAGIGAFSRMRKWGNSLKSDKPGHFEASVDLTPAS